MWTVTNDRGVYYIYIDGKFYCSCDNNKELAEELEELKRNNKIK
jgi:hypothetical protein